MTSAPAPAPAQREPELAGQAPAGPAAARAPGSAVGWMRPGGMLLLMGSAGGRRGGPAGS